MRPWLGFETLCTTRAPTIELPWVREARFAYMHDLLRSLRASAMEDAHDSQSHFVPQRQFRYHD